MITDLEANSLDKYQQSLDERLKHVNAILMSESQKKVVVAGPGTGKTYLFKEILRGKKETLTLTFVNSLVEDLCLELYGISDVKTLHGYGRSILSSILKRDIKIFPKLSKIIREESKIILGEDISFDQIFYDRDDSNEHLKFYEARRQYFDYYGYTDVIYAAVMCLENNNGAIPIYQQVLVDEFQDFNKLEVSLIDLLAEKSPILLAGDDDQALYEFKNANPSHIRDRHGIKRPEYAAFNLPFCARCPRVIVEATNDLIVSAQQNGLLIGRIDKPYKYFLNRDKDKISENYSKVVYTNVYANQIPWFIEKCLAKMALDIKDKFSVLIISPYKKQSHAIAKALKDKGLNNIEYTESIEENEITLLDGFKLLIQDIHDNLGWRIAAQFILNKDDFILLVRNTHTNPSKKIYEYLSAEIIKDVNETVKALKYIKEGKPINPELLSATFNRFNIDPKIIATEFLQVEINTATIRTGNPALRKIPIKATTIQSSKGLAADIVFITHFDDRYFITNKDKKIISDRDICNFIVALTRTKKNVFLISSINEIPTFLKWISKDKIIRA